MKMLVLTLLIMINLDAFAGGGVDSGGGGVDSGGGGKPTSNGRWIVDYGNRKLDLGKLIEGQMDHPTLTQNEINILIGHKLKKKKINLGELMKSNPDMDHIQTGDVVDFDDGWTKALDILNDQ